jgi:BASS family bile acid:Na+ symporter
MVTIGLGVSLGDLASFIRNWRLVCRAALANYLYVPAITVGLLLFFAPHPMVSAGFLILAVCPGAPYGPPVTAIARGNVAVAAGLMVILAGSSAIVAPVLLHYLLVLVVSGSQPQNVNATRIVATLLATQLVPLCVGLALRQWYPRLADRLKAPGTLISKVLNLLVLGFILIAQFHLFAEIRLRAFLGMLFLLIASWASGGLLGGPDVGIRRAMTLSTSLRNVGVGLVIATGTFAGTPAVTAVLVYGLFEVLGTLVLALTWGRRSSGQLEPPEIPVLA